MSGGTFPTSIPSYPAISPTETLGTMGGGEGLEVTIENIETDVTEIATKIGDGPTIDLDKLTAGGTDGDIVQQVAGELALVTPTPPTPPAMVLLGTQTLGADAASIDFTSISQSYKSLVFKCRFRSTAAEVAGYVSAQVGNGSFDTGSNYDSNDQYSGGSGAAGGSPQMAQSSWRLGQMPGTSGSTGNFSGVELEIKDYTNGVRKICQFHCCCIPTGTGSESYVGDGGGVWRSNSAIDRVRFQRQGGGGNLLAGSTVHMFGIV